MPGIFKFLIALLTYFAASDLGLGFVTSGPHPAIEMLWFVSVDNGWLELLVPPQLEDLRRHPLLLVYSWLFWQRPFGRNVLPTSQI